MKKDIKNIPSSIRAKLQNKARETHRLLFVNHLMRLIKQKNLMWDGKLPALGDDTASTGTFTSTVNILFF